MVQFKRFQTIKPCYWDGEQHIPVELNEQETNALLLLQHHHTLNDPQGPLDIPTITSLKEKGMVETASGRVKPTPHGWDVIRKFELWIAADQAYSKTVIEKIKQAADEPELKGKIHLPEVQWPFVEKSRLPVECLLKFIAYSDALQQVVDELNEPPNFGDGDLYSLEDLQAALIFAAHVISIPKPEM